jgi:hypothetical protein
MNKQQTMIVLVVLVLVLGFFGWRQNWFRSIAPVEQTTVSPTEYKNTEFGFGVSLPQSWVGYTVVESTWAGYGLKKDGNEQMITEGGPLVSVRHPQWTASVPRQDIPVMVFTIQQWNDMQADKFHIGAAPINPSELARNSEYVFALPARYNFAYLPGYEEVDQIVQSKSVKAF